MAAGAGTMQWFQRDELRAIDGKRAVLEAVVTTSAADDDSNTDTVVSRNIVPLATPGEMLLPNAGLTVSALRSVSDDVGQNNSSSSASFFAEIRGDAMAMYATLTTLAHGHFADNALLFRPPSQRVEFIPAPYSGLTHADAEAAFAAFAQSLRVEDVSGYQ
jgi:hypothetical protein